MKRLCFGTFAQVLRLCKLENVIDRKLIGMMTRTVDPNCQYIHKDNASAVSRLFSCKGNLSNGNITDSGSSAIKKPGKSISNVVNASQNAKKEEVVQAFNKEVIPLLDEDKKELIVLALLDIIENDDVLDGEKKLNFEKHIGTTKKALLSQGVFELDEFLAGVFLYTVAAGIKNTLGKQCVKELTIDYIKGLKNSREVKVVNHCTKTIKDFSDRSVSGENDLEQELKHKDSLMAVREHKQANKYKGKIVYLPFLKNYNFVGRSKELEMLCSRFVENKSNMPTIQTIHGLGGVGKTQLALKYAYDNLDEYDAICWVECINEDSIQKSCCDFLVATGESDAEICQFTHWFQNYNNWLLILDDINENIAVEHLIPKIGRGDIIKTTQIVEGKQVDSLTIPLDKMIIKEAVKFLVMSTCDNDEESARAIAYRLGQLPLALEQVASYINELEIDLAGYLKLLCEHDLGVFDGRDSVKNYRWNVKNVWDITLKCLSNPAKQLLYCFSYMSAEILALDLLMERAKKIHAERVKPDEFIERIGKDGKSVKINMTRLLRKYDSSNFSSELITLLADDIKCNRAVRELKKFSLIKSKKDKTLTMHGLVQEVIRQGISDSVYLLSVAEVLKKWCSEIDWIYDDYHIALPIEKAKSIILNIETLLKYRKEYERSLDRPNLYMWELEFVYYSFVAQYFTLRGISENDIKMIEEADGYYAEACEMGLALYGGGEDDHLSGAAKFKLIQEKHRRMRVNLILNRVDMAKKLYYEIRKPVSKVINYERHMSFHAFKNFGDLWKEFGYYLEAKECYEYILELSSKDELNTFREKIAECEEKLAIISN